MDRKKERKVRFVVGALCTVTALYCSALLLLPDSGGWLVLPAVISAILAVAALIGKRGVPVLTYHSVTRNGGWLPWSRDICVHPDTLSAQLNMLKRMGMRAISTKAMDERRQAGKRPLKDGFVLHFDDGYRDNLEVAAPIVQTCGMTATCFISLDFVEPGDAVRAASADGCPTGYLNWAEIRSLRDKFGWEIEPHGLDHGRVATSGASVDTLTDDNWKTHAWLQWRHMQGPKHGWYRGSFPPAVPLGSAVPESGLALACREWKNGALEPEHSFTDRLRHHLGTCRTVFVNQLGHAPRFFCWPENKACSEGREIAMELGYSATTGGTGRNTAGESADTISRIHVGERALGIRWPAADALYLRAQVRLVQGRFYWYGLIALMHGARHAVLLVQKRRIRQRRDGRAYA